MPEKNLKKLLNPSQLASVTTVGGPVLVIAGAGSGKTRAIEYRVSYLIQKNISPESVLLLTFTRKASREMLSRASRHEARCQHVDGGTFHSFAFRTLKKYAKVLGLSGLFSILDEGDAEEAIQRCGTKLGFFDKKKKFPKKNTLRTIISMSVNKGMPIEETIAREYPHFLEFIPQVENLRKEYAAYKIQKNYLDYDDLLVYLKLLLENKEVRGRLSRRYRYIMVDEYQDTNTLQGDITYLLAEQHRNVMVVGDDAQSIYGFRGASHKNIMKFPERFPECKVIKLEENYRSTQHILDIANAVLENMRNKYSKCLVAVRKEAGETPKLNFFKNTYDEAEWIVSKIIELRNDGVTLSQQAALFRSTYVSISLQAELSKHNIPFEVYGGLRFYETAHAKDVMAHLKVLANIKDELAWNRVLMLIEGIGPKTAEKLFEKIMAQSTLKNVVEKVLRKSEKAHNFSAALQRLGTYLKSAAEGGVSTGELYGMALDYYAPLMKRKFDDWHLRANDLEALRQIAGRYTSLTDLLGDFAIEPPARGVWRVEPEAKGEEKPLVLSTIHSSKGLEWDTVFVIGLIEGVLPVSFALGDDEEIEEESRLFYVAITRAKNGLFLSLNHEGMRGGITQFNKISRFIDTRNVLANLDQKVILPPGAGEDTDFDEEDGITPIYDKDDLLRNVMDFFR